MSNPVQPPTASTVFGGSSPAAPGATDLPDAYGNPTVGTPAYNARAATRTQLLQAGYKPGTPEYDAAYTQQAQAGGYADSTLAQMKASGAAPPRYIDPNSGGTFYDKGGTLNTFTGPQGLAQLGNQNAQYLGGQQGTAGALASGLQMQAAGAEGRGGPAINTAMPNFFAGGVGQGIQNAQGSNLAVAQNALSMAGTATGAGYQGALGTAQALGAQANGQAVQGQFGAAQQLQGMAGMPAGPSVAQQQLRMGSDAAMQQQMAMASGARGGNTALASANAGAQQGAIEGQLNQNQALLRAQEDMANRTFSANALQGAAGIYGNAGQAQTGALGAAGAAYGQAAGIQQQGYGAAGQAFQGIANNQLGQAAQANTLTSTYAGMAGQQLGADMNQRSLNDQSSIALQGLGINTLQGEQNAALQQQGQNLNVNLGAYGTNMGASAAQNARNDDLTRTILGGSIAAAGAVAAPFTGGASLAAVPAGTAIAKSDITSKKNISAAGEQVSDAIRGVQVPYPMASGVGMQAPAYAYEYKDPSSNGARPGVNYGPMAQDLEKTPAGASVVVDKGGKKGIDTSRLTLLNTSELSKMRQELDALSGSAASIRGAPVSYPQPVQPAYRLGGY